MDGRDRQVVIGDRASRHGCAQGDQRAAAGDGQGVGLIGFVDGVADDANRNLHRSLPRGNCVFERGLRQIVDGAARGRAVSRGYVKHDIAGDREAKRRSDDLGGNPRVALWSRCRIADRQHGGGGIIVDDSGLTLRIRHGRAHHIGEVDEEGLVGFVGGIAIDRDHEVTTAGAFGNGHTRLSNRQIVVVRKRRRAVRTVDVEAHATDGCGCAKADGEGEVAGAAVAFHLADIVDADGGQRRCAAIGG